MRRGFLAPQAKPAAPGVTATVAFSQGEAALAAGRLVRAFRFFSYALRLNPDHEGVAGCLRAVRFAATQRLQALARGTASRRRDPYRNLSVRVVPGDRTVRSSRNLPRYLNWLGQEFQEGGDRLLAAREVHRKLAVTHHNPEANAPILTDSVFGPLPGTWCSRRPCPRCDGAGGFDLSSPLSWGPSRGGWHFRHLGPWSNFDELLD